MMQVNVHEAKTHLSRLLTKVESGEEITIAKAGKPVARLIPIDHNVVKRIPGTANGVPTDQLLDDGRLRSGKQIWPPRSNISRSVRAAISVVQPRVFR